MDSINDLIYEKGYKRKYIAELLGLGYVNFQDKVLGRKDFKGFEFYLLSNILDVPVNDLLLFVNKVQCEETI